MHSQHFRAGQHQESLENRLGDCNRAHANCRDDLAPGNTNGMQILLTLSALAQNLALVIPEHEFLGRVD